MLTHKIRWTAEKITQRLGLIEPLVYRRRQPLPPFRYLPLDGPLAAERAESEEIDLIMATVQEQERQHHLPDGDPFAADMEFHRLILQAAKNPVLTRMMEAVTELSLESQRRTARIEGMMSKGIHFHYLIASAIQQCDMA